MVQRRSHRPAVVSVRISAWTPPLLPTDWQQCQITLAPPSGVAFAADDGHANPLRVRPLARSADHARRRRADLRRRSGAEESRNVKRRAGRLAGSLILRRLA